MSGPWPAQAIVVGGAGFIGSHFVDHLLGRPETARVTVYDNFSSGRDWHLAGHAGDARLRVVRADAKDRERLTEVMAGHELVIHLASNPDIARAMVEPAIDFDEGVLLTHHVIEAMRRLRRVPRDNGIVSITVGAWEGRQIAEVPFLGGYLQVATGAFTLAHQTGAPLLPVFAVLNRDTGTFRVLIEPALQLGAGLDRGDAIELAMVDYAGRLEPYVRRYPDQWRGWSEWHAYDSPG